MLVVSDVPRHVIESLLRRYGIELLEQAADSEITASFWGGEEAGIVGRTVYVRGDTPIHSLLHEICHIICMDAERRATLHRDAGGDDIEESAVCYLQVLLADQLPGVGRQTLMSDMDAWGYSFRLGSTLDWFQSDAQDAFEFLLNHGLVDAERKPTFKLRA